jgi:cytosine/adenosine deaminase-related metal-dependent hydrolase
MHLSGLLLALAAPQADSRLLEGALVHTLVPGETPRTASVWIEDGRIRAVGTDLEVPPEVPRLDLAGRHLVPALIDGFVNFDRDHDLLYLAAGVGLVRDVGGDRVKLLAEREEGVRAAALGPDLLTAGAVLDGDPAASPEAIVLRDAAAASALLEVVLADGVDFLSFLPGLPEDAWKRTIELGHAKELQVWGPLRRGATVAAALEGGQDGFHFLDVVLPSGIGWERVLPPALDESIALLAQAKVPVVPLFNASASRLQDPSKSPEVARLLGLLAPSYESWWKAELEGRFATLRPEFLEVGERAVAAQRAALGRLHAAGVPLLPGSGAPQPWLVPGSALGQELLAFEAAGIPPADVLRLATRGAAEILGLAGRYGSIEAGAEASLLVLLEDPRESVANLVDVERMILRGRPIEPEEIERGLAELAERHAATRAALAAPLDVEPPPVPEGALILLEGRVETRALGLRLSQESYRVARLPDDKLAFVGHVVFAVPGDAPARDMLVLQITEDGGLVSATVALREGERVLRHEGLWSAGTWRMRRTLDDKQVDTRSTGERPRAIDAGSVTLDLVLSQVPFAERLPVIVFHEGLVPESVAWRMEPDDRGNHQVRTHLGRRAFRQDDHGALAEAVSAVGASRVEVRSLASNALGGAGLVLPEEKRRALEDRRAAPAPAAAPAEDGGGSGSRGGG